MEEQSEHYKAFIKASREAMRANPELAHNLKVTLDFFDTGGAEILEPRLSAHRLKELLRERLEQNIQK